MELTKEYFDQSIEQILDKKLDQKLDQKLKPLQEDLSSVKELLADIKFKVDQTAILAVNFSEDHKEVPKKIDEIHYVQNIHTNSLDTLMTEWHKKSDEKTVEMQRLDRDEKTIKDLAARSSLKLDW